MENHLQQHSEDHQMQILKFMEITQCESYEQAQLYVAMYDYRLKGAIDAYVSSKDKAGQSNRTTSTNPQSPARLMQQRNLSHNIQFSFSPEQALILEQRLRDSSSSRKPSSRNSQSNQYGLCSKISKSCRNWFKCLEKLKKSFKKKANSMKKDDQKIFYFTDLYQEQLYESGFEVEIDLIDPFELSNVEQTQKMKASKNQAIKPIFALIVPNRKSSLIVSFLQNRQTMQFIRQNFEVVLLTLSELKQINLPRNHSLRNIKKCPTAVTYVKNFYELEDVLGKFQGEQLKNVTVAKLKQSLQQVPNMLKKWNSLLELEKQLKQNSITSLQQVAQDYYDQDFDEDRFDASQQQQSFNEGNYDSKKSLIQEQTQIYEEMVAEENKRKKSIEIEKQRLEELQELRQVRKMSIPAQPTADQSQQCIEFRFRCPLNGQHVTRKFLKNQKVDILYQFVDTNDSIEFETDPERNFDLFSSFPPTSLSDKKDQLLSEVFDQEKENILIREA